MAILKLEGTIKYVNEIEEISEKFRKQVFGLETTNDKGEFPQLIPMECTNDRISMIENISIGTEVVVSFVLNGKEVQLSNGETKNFLNVVCLGIEKK
jgi:hypothetical protein